MHQPGKGEKVDVEKIVRRIIKVKDRIIKIVTNWVCVLRSQTMYCTLIPYEHRFIANNWSLTIPIANAIIGTLVYYLAI